MNELVYDLNQFADMWLSNPEARRDFARLVERSASAMMNAKTERAVREWVKSEERVATAAGVR